MTLPRIIDLMALADGLAGRPEHDPLVGKLRSAARAQSCLADLRQAAMCVEVYGAVRDTGEAGRPDYRTIQQSLIVNAVTLYARATTATGQYGERGGIQIIDKLTSAERVDHDAIVALRNRVFAHVYPGEEREEGVWNEPRMYALADEPSPIGCMTRNTQTRLETFNRIQRAIPIATELVATQTQKRIGQATKAFNDVAPHIAVEPYLRSAADYFGGEDVARSMLAARPPGGSAILFTEDHVDGSK